jgi:adenylate kinase
MSELNLVLLGPPGSGKGTQGERLQEDFELPYYATGNILRGAVEEKTELGQTAKEYMDNGDLVPDDVICGVIAERELADLDRDLTATILIEVPDEEVERRLGGRRTCVENGHVFHVDFNPPEKEGVCDIDGSRLIVREDDKPEVIRHRLETYHEKTEPLISFYEDKGLLRRVDGTETPDEVGDRIRALLATLRMEEDI